VGEPELLHTNRQFHYTYIYSFVISRSDWPHKMSKWHYITEHVNKMNVLLNNFPDETDRSRVASRYRYTNVMLMLTQFIHFPTYCELALHKHNGKEAANEMYVGTTFGALLYQISLIHN
jgi:hypothetical protein